MTEHVEALVEKEMLVWARKTAQLPVHIVAQKTGVNEEHIKSWENGDSRPSIQQLRALARVYKRPIAVFYLPEAPKDFAPLHDFRRSTQKQYPISPDLQFEIRHAYERRQIVLELFDEMGYFIPKFSINISLDDNPEVIALKLRDILKISRNAQLRFTDDHESLSAWRSSLEKLGVLVFQTFDVSMSEIRGFTISERPMPVILVNTKDSPRGRTFTMLHEFIHLALKHEGLCDLGDQTNEEVFCNRVAAAILVPRDSLLLEEAVLENGVDEDWSDEEIVKIANKYKVSEEVIVRRLLSCQRVTADFYRKKRAEYEQRYLKLPKSHREGFVPPAKEAIITSGKPFIKLVLEGYNKKKITASDVSDFLTLKLKHLNSVQQELSRIR